MHPMQTVTRIVVLTRPCKLTARHSLGQVTLECLATLFGVIRISACLKLLTLKNCIPTAM